MSDEAMCPYCKTLQEINHDDGYGYSEDETSYQWCVECELEFAFTTSLSCSYTVECDGRKNPHKWVEWFIEPSMEECSACGKTRLKREQP